jgi:hypothetical protein
MPIAEPKISTRISFKNVLYATDLRATRAINLVVDRSFTFESEPMVVAALRRWRDFCQSKPRRSDVIRITNISAPRHPVSANKVIA